MENISLIPKSEKERGLPRFVSFQRPQLKLGPVSKGGLALIAAVAILYGGAYFWQARLNKDLGGLNGRLQAVIGQRDMALENRLSGLGMALETFKSVFTGHRYWSKVFDMLEQSTLSDITFVSFDGNAAADRISLKGRAPSYAVLAQQIKLFQDAPDVIEVTTSGINLNQKGYLDFSVMIVFDRSLLIGK